MGFTDDVGSDAYNLDLSQKRAQEVARLLSSTFHIDPVLIEAKGKGVSKEYATRELNRRVEIYIFHE
jgi:outer membrane protein OmpA-like peptidoglycan-associated protein